jgi:hypothetical protein
MSQNAYPLPTPTPGTIGKLKLRSGWCAMGATDPEHVDGRCRPLSWSPSVPGWMACPCACHEDDLLDPARIEELVADAYQREYYWRAEHAGVVKRKPAAPIATDDAATGVDVPVRSTGPGRKASVADVELRTFVVREVEVDPSVSVWTLLKRFRADGGSASSARFRRVFDEVRKGS